MLITLSLLKYRTSSTFLSLVAHRVDVMIIVQITHFVFTNYYRLILDNCNHDSWNLGKPSLIFVGMYWLRCWLGKYLEISLFMLQIWRGGFFDTLHHNVDYVDFHYCSWNWLWDNIQDKVQLELLEKCVHFFKVRLTSFSFQWHKIVTFFSKISMRVL